MVSEEPLLFLGLKPREARVYIALLRLSEAEVKAISEKAMVPRQDIYPILSKLEKLGLVEVQVETPTKFKVTPPNVGLRELLKLKTEEFSKNAERVLALIATAEKERNPAKPQNFQLTLTRSRGSALRIRKEAVSRVRICMDINTTFKRFCQLWNHLDYEFKSALNRGVRLRFIITRPKSSIVLSAVTGKVIPSPLLSIKYSSRPLTSVFVVCDKKDLYYVIEFEKDLLLSPILFTNEPTLVSAMQDYFEQLWEKSTMAQ